jgi:P4 family phage/plasmid primase-like protien
MLPHAASKKLDDVELGKALEDVRSGQYAKQIKAVRAAYKKAGKSAAGPLKKQLPAILFSGHFTQRNDEDLEQHSGIIVADLDELDRPISELRDKLKEDPHVIFLFLSPTGSGLKVGFRVPPDADRHAASFAAVDAHMKLTYDEEIDPACKNLSRLCFTSHDPDLYVNWKAEELEVPETIPADQCHKDDSPTVFAETVNRFGNPYYIGENGHIKTINQRFWAGLYLTENHLLYEPDERQFYEYVEERGLWCAITDELLREHVATRLLVFSRESGGEEFEKKISRTIEDNIIAHLKGQAEKIGIFDEKKRIIHCANGVLRLQPKGDAIFTEFSVDDYSRNQSPIEYHPEAECPRFLNELILNSVGGEDALLIQKWMGLALLGDNAPQKVIILDGQPGGGKSTLIRVIRTVVGSRNVYELRTQHLGDRFELFRYSGKTLLIGSDVSGDFLMHKYAYVIKSLVGGDPLSGECKNSNGSFDIKGNFNIVISCNTRLKVLLEGDIGAWKRRLLIVRYDKAPPTKPIPDFDVQLVEEEGSGILNWALEGLEIAFTDIDETGTLLLSREQERRIDALLSESESVRHFAQGCLIADPNGDVTSDEAVTAYAEYCSDRSWNPLPITTVQQQLPDLMLELFRSAKSHGVQRDGKSQRGWKGVRLADVAPEHFDL